MVVDAAVVAESMLEKSVDAVESIAATPAASFSTGGPG